MVDHVTARLAAALAISEDGRTSFGPAGAAAVSSHHFAVGRLLSVTANRRADPKAFLGTMTSLWGLGNRLSARAVKDRFVFQFSNPEDRQRTVEGGPWFFGKWALAMAEFDGLKDPAQVLTSSFPVWVEIMGLPPALVTEGAVALIGATLGEIVHLDKAGIRKGTAARVRIRHVLSSPVKQVFPPSTFDFTSAASATVRFRYERLVGFCRVCGMMEHQRSGCGGPPAALQVSFGANPNPSLVGSAAPSLAEVLAQSTAPNLFTSVAKSTSLQGFSVSALAA
ncbi:uncharacterized protein LOC133730980 [Rosa rugosa]|uniref:uncharacterized protein LOC133730980 n=1 Tax=Rosa rugosa TaxID=74645 RepID=UPI002B41150F|nr:uncharacterized protein LOC133730980 [Rosa rugosa]